MLLKAAKGVVLAIDTLAAVVFITLFAYLLPGDNANANVLGSIVLMAAVAAVAVGISVPVERALRRRNDSLFTGIEFW